MNAKLTILILVAMIAAVLVPVSAENVYVDRNPAKFDVLPTSDYGYLIVYVRGVTVQDPLVFIDREKSNRTFDPSYHPDHSVIVDQNEGMQQVKLLADGVSEPVMLAAGNYTAYMRQGNSDQPEQYDFKIGGGAIERVVFLGAAIPPQDSVKCKNFTVVDVGEWLEHFGNYNGADVYVGMGFGDYVREYTGDDPYVYEYVAPVVHPETTMTVCHDPVTHEEWVEEVNHTVHHDAITHEEFVEDGHYYIHDWKYFIGQGWKVKCSNHAEHGEGWHTQTAACTEAYGHYETIIDTPAWDEIVVDEPGHWITVTDVEGYCEVIVVEPEWTEHFGAYDASHNYVGAGNGDYIRTSNLEYTEYTLVYIPPVLHEASVHYQTVCSIFGEPQAPVTQKAEVA